MIEVNYNEYKETIADNMKLIQENHKLKETIKEAIEELKTLSKLYEDNYTISDKAKDIIDILKGSDKE